MTKMKMKYAEADHSVKPGENRGTKKRERERFLALIFQETSGDWLSLGRI